MQDDATRANPGWFKPGQSGNPAGKQPGTRNRATVIAEQIAEDAIGDITRAAVEKAKSGDRMLCRVFYERAVPRRRGHAVEVELPAVDTPAGIVAAGAALLAATAAGELSPEEAQSLAGLVEMQRRSLETVELERRIAALERQAGLDEAIA